MNTPTVHYARLTKGRRWHIVVNLTDETALCLAKPRVGSYGWEQTTTREGRPRREGSGRMTPTERAELNSRLFALLHPGEPTMKEVLIESDIDRWEPVAPVDYCDWAALPQLLEAMTAAGWHAQMTTPFAPGKPYFAGFTPHNVSGWNGRPDYEAKADTLPLAVALAALGTLEATLERLKTNPWPCGLCKTPTPSYDLAWARNPQEWVCHPCYRKLEKAGALDGERNDR